MHNFIKSSVTVKDSLSEVGKWLRNPKKSFFDANKELLDSLYGEYNTLATKDELHKLNSQWSIVTGMDEKSIVQAKTSRYWAHRLYGDDRPFVSAHWENLTVANGGETLYCPICGLHECEEMDHFVPRDEGLFPEYSAHLSNLIPLCHSCNHKKSNKFLDKNGKRIFFNAYYDILINRNLLVCDISISDKDGMPQIITSLNPILSPTNKPDVYILSTVHELGLLKRFEAKAKLCLKRELLRLKKRAGQEWSIIRDEMQMLATPIDGDPDIVTPSVLGAIAASKVIEAWFTAL